ncbi:MAG: pyridoxine 5'-phosphate synthase [Candidatus Omnitrophica bacterium]|nr:pyridoxine 5'-phosphate synthase [Candidatus Omnitrophota bacterium]
MIRLGVNIDHIATLRQARKGKEPDPAFAALLCENAGADSIVAHLREDRRHIQVNDLYILRKIIKTRLNLEMSINKEIVELASQILPDQATLVPEKRQELTTEGGLDIINNLVQIKKTVAKLKAKNISVSLFIDPEIKQIHAAQQSGANAVELHTGEYAAACIHLRMRYLKNLKRATDYARKLKLQVFAGHGLDYRNVKGVAGINGIEELNIGYSIICRAVIVGIEKAVKEIKDLIL